VNTFLGGVFLKLLKGDLLLLAVSRYIFFWLLGNTCFFMFLNIFSMRKIISFPNVENIGDLVQDMI